ncbi:hypothetical protein TUM12370_33950 [Salmonella enterica subsp. enterica serovar Choleraesuis]|nr:hypothetical protein TUM12370_33950 [Salmonella enterica subsp. enterica serovar Choleraesuis]
MKIIAIEANIAAGKSALLTPLCSELEVMTGKSWSVIVEPVDRDPIFLELLAAFVRSPDDADVRIKFQMYITTTRQQLLKNIGDGNYLIERSLFSDIVFCQTNFLTTERPGAEYMNYFYKIKEYLKDYPPIDLVVYVDRDPEACLASCRQRARNGEENYTLDYFQDLKYFHDACLPQITRKYNTQLLTYPVGADFADAKRLAQVIHQKMGW